MRGGARWHGMIGAIAYLVFVPTLCAWAQAEAPHVLTLQDAMRIAIERNPSIATAQSDLDASRAALEGQRARRLPTLALSASGQIQDSLGRSTTGGGGTSETSDVELALQHVFFQSGREEAIDSARWQLAASEAGIENTRRTLAQTVASTYFTILANQQLAEVAEEAVSSAELDLELVETRIEVGAAAEADRMPVEADLAQARYEAIRALNAIWQSLAELRALLALPPDELPLLADRLDDVPAVDALDVWLAEALAHRPDLRAQHHRLRVAELSVRQAEIDDGLTLGVDGQAGYGRHSGTAGESWQLWAGVSLPLFDRGSDASVRQARANLESSRQRLAELELTTTREVTQAWYALRDARERIVAAEAALEAAATNLEVARARYAEEAANVIEVTDAELTWRRASATLVQARYDRAVAYYRLLAAAGRPLIEQAPAE